MEQELIMSPAISTTETSASGEVSMSQMFGVLGNPEQTTKAPSEIEMPKPKIVPIWMTKKLQKGVDLYNKTQSKLKENIEAAEA